MLASRGQLSVIEKLYAQLGCDDEHPPKANLKRASKMFMDVYRSTDGRPSMHIIDWEQDAGELTTMVQKFLESGFGLSFWKPSAHSTVEYPKDVERLTHLIKQLFYHLNNQAFENDKQRKLPMSHGKPRAEDRPSEGPNIPGEQARLIFTRKFELKGVQYQRYRATFADSSGNRVAPIANMILAPAEAVYTSSKPNQLGRMPNPSSERVYQKSETAMKSAMTKKTRDIWSPPSDSDECLHSPSNMSDGNLNTNHFGEDEEDRDYCDDEVEGDDNLPNSKTRYRPKRTLPQGIDFSHTSSESIKRRRKSDTEYQTTAEEKVLHVENNPSYDRHRNLYTSNRDRDQGRLQRYASDILAHSHFDGVNKGSGDREQEKEASATAIDTSLSGKTRKIRPCKACSNAHIYCNKEEPCLRCTKRKSACIYPDRPPRARTSQAPRRNLPLESRKTPVAQQRNTPASMHNASTSGLWLAATGGSTQDMQESRSVKTNPSCQKPMSEQTIFSATPDDRSEASKDRSDIRLSSPSDRVQGDFEAITTNTEHEQDNYRGNDDRPDLPGANQSLMQLALLDSSSGLVKKEKPEDSNIGLPTGTQPTDPGSASSRCDVDYWIKAWNGPKRFKKRWWDQLDNKDVYTLFKSISTYIPGRMIQEVEIVLSCEQHEFSQTFTGVTEIIKRGEHNKLVVLQKDIQETLQEGVGLGAHKFSIELNLAAPDLPASNEEKKAVKQDPVIHF